MPTDLDWNLFRDFATALSASHAEWRIGVTRRRNARTANTTMTTTTAAGLTVNDSSSAGR